MKITSQLYSCGPNADAPFDFALKRKLMLVCILLCVFAFVCADSGENVSRRLEERAQTIIKTIP